MERRKRSQLHSLSRSRGKKETFCLRTKSNNDLPRILDCSHLENPSMRHLSLKLTLVGHKSRVWDKSSQPESEIQEIHTKSLRDFIRKLKRNRWSKPILKSTCMQRIHLSQRSTQSQLSHEWAINRHQVVDTTLKGPSLVLRAHSYWTLWMVNRMTDLRKSMRPQQL